MTQLTNIAFIRAKQGQTNALGDRLNELVTPSRQEAGCINYDVHQAANDSDLWFVYENWRSAEDLAAHFDAPHMKKFVADIPNLVDGELQLQEFRMISTQVNPHR